MKLGESLSGELDHEVWEKSETSIWDIVWDEVDNQCQYSVRKKTTLNTWEILDEDLRYRINRL